MDTMKNGADDNPPEAVTPQSWDLSLLHSLIKELGDLRTSLQELETYCSSTLTKLAPTYRLSSVNLLHYLALRRHDLRALQNKLSALGFSSLGGSEAHVMASVEAVLRLLCALVPDSRLKYHHPHPEYAEGYSLLEQHTQELLGPRPGQRRVRLMVTMPSEAADDYLLVRELLAEGMDVMRINCAHDTAQQWQRMVENLHRAKRELGKNCRIFMDLGGPKLRTGPLESVVQVIKWRPVRDRFGRVHEPARIWLTPAEKQEIPDIAPDATVPLAGEWLARLRVGDRIAFRDARGAKRSLSITGKFGHSLWGTSSKTCYLTAGTMLTLVGTGKRHRATRAAVGKLPPVPGSILLKSGDLLILTRDPAPGKGARYDDRGRLVASARISCTPGDIFDQVRPGERIWFDDGKIGGVIRSVNGNEIKTEITQARPKGEKLRAERGINLPDSRLTHSSLTDRDVEDLSFVVQHAHMVGLSFVQQVEDLYRLQALLEQHGTPHLGVVLKIETKRGFEMLPDLIIAAMRNPVVGVMIARGDLAVECGYERLAEIQEEILWLCEAAHIPVIWATQVLENLTKTGIASRAEISDAAMSERAECVMLNKGPHICEAMRVLTNILERMAPHQSKRRAMLRQLRWWERTQAHCDIENLEEFVP